MGGHLGDEPGHYRGAVLQQPDGADIARVSMGGRRVRVRLSNAYGQKKLAIGAAHIGLRDKDARIVPGSDRKLTFGGADGIAIPAGALGAERSGRARTAGARRCGGEHPHSRARCRRLSRSPATATGIRRTMSRRRATMPPPSTCRIERTTENWYLLTGIDVLAPLEAGGIVTLGDSLTDANLSTLDANARWPDQLARRIVARRGGRPLGVMNQGIGGNRILHDTRGDSGVKRFDRDVLAQPGATHVIVFLGTNDLRNRGAKPEEEVTAAQMIAGLRQIAERGQAAGLKVFGCTLLPFENETFLPGAWNPNREKYRRRRQRLDPRGGRLRCGHRFRQDPARSRAPDQHAAEI